MSLKEQLNNLLQKFQSGGTVNQDWKQQYSTNPYFKNREDWGDKLDVNFPNSKVTARQAVYDASKQTGIDPGLLYTSSMEEGMKLALNGQDTFERREGYNQFRKSNPKGAQEFPIDGGYFYGLNTFGDKYGKVIKPSSLPRGFKYAPYEQKDAQGNTLYTSAAFRSHDDAIAAKAAMMKQVESAMTARLQKNGLNLSPEARKFFDMVGYNMGEDKTIDMIKSYQEKGYLKDDKFLDPNFQPASWKEPYTNVQRRYQNYKILNEQGYFNDYSTSPSMVNTPKATNNPYQDGGYIEEERTQDIEPVVINGKIVDEKDIRSFYNDVLSSDWFKERLKKNGYGYFNRSNTDFITKLFSFPKSKERIDNEVKGRKRNIDATYYYPENSVTGTSFSLDHDTNEKWIDNNYEQLDDLKAHPRTAVVHEFGHAEISPDYSDRPSDNKVYGSLSGIEQDIFEKNFKNPKTDYGKYVEDPKEAKSDINAIRYNLYRAKVFDPKTGNYQTEDGKFNPVLLEKIKNDFSTKRMIDAYGEDGLTELLNTIAINNSENEDRFYAQRGGIKRGKSSENIEEMLSNNISYFTGLTNSSQWNSPYKPTISKDKNIQYKTYQYLREDVLKDLIESNHDKVVNSAQDNWKKQKPNYNPVYYDGSSFGSYYNMKKATGNKINPQGSSINLGKYKTDVGEDDRGRYISVSDTFDYNSLKGLGFKGNPSEIYDRIYEDEWNEYLKQMNKYQKGGTLKDQLNTLQMKYGGKV